MYARVPVESSERQGRWIYMVNPDDCRRHGFIFEGPVFLSSYQWADEIAAWCRDKYGTDLQRWSRHGAWAFRFRDEADAFEFRLRWC